MTRDQIAAVLGKLRVDKGGRRTRVRFNYDWTISMEEQPARDRADEHPHVLVLSHRNGRSSMVPLAHSVDTHTKTRYGRWLRSCVWRLRPEAIEKFAAQIERVMQDPRAARVSDPGK